MPTIAEATAEHLFVPLAQPMGGSRITEVEVIAVDLECDGELGIGFTYTYGGGGLPVLAATRHLLQNVVVGRELVPPQAAWRSMRQALRQVGSGIGYVAIAAIDLAWWDLWAKRLHLPLGIALGGVSRTVPVYGSAGFDPTQSPEEAAATAAAYVARGIKAVKPRAMGDHTDLLRLQAVRAVVGADGLVMVDLAERGNLLSVMRLAEQARLIDLTWLEEPLPARDLPAYASLARGPPVAVAVGEHLFGAGHMQRDPA